MPSARPVVPNEDQVRFLTKPPSPANWPGKAQAGSRQREVGREKKAGTFMIFAARLTVVVSRGLHSFIPIGVRLHGRILLEDLTTPTTVLSKEDEGGKPTTH